MRPGPSRQLRAPARAIPLALAAAAAVGGCARSPVLEAGPRVVSLHDVTTEVMVRLGAVDRLAGVSPPVDASDAVVGAIAGVPRVAGLESILAVRPGLVLGLPVVEAQDPALVRALRAAGVEVLLSAPRRLEDVADLVEAIAGRVGAAAVGRTLAGEVRAAAAAAPPRGGRPRRVFVYDCCEPPFTAGRDTVLTDLIRRSGGENVFSSVDADWAHVSWEEVVASRPELIVMHRYRDDDREDGQGGVADKRRTLDRIPGLRGVRTLVMPLGESLGGLRSLEGLARLRDALSEGTSRR